MLPIPVRLALMGMMFAALITPRDANALKIARPLKTGQTQCWNSAGTEIDCTGSPQDGALQRGVVRKYTDQGDGTIADRKTGLVWEKLSNDDSIHDKDTVWNWVGAFTKIGILNTPPCFAGFCDWRLPNRFELDTLVDAGEFTPSISPDFNGSCLLGCTVLTCSCPPIDSHFWTSTAHVGDPTHAWAISFADGEVNAKPKINSHYVRAVRGGL